MKRRKANTIIPSDILIVNAEESFEQAIVKKKFRIYNDKITIMKIKHEYFEIIREKYGITEGKLLRSMSLESNKANIFKVGEGEGKSGSFFFFTYDKKFIIKTVSSAELKTFSKFINKYSQHITDRYGSIISIILAVYTLKITSLAPIHIIVMINSLPQQDNYVRIIFAHIYSR